MNRMTKEARFIGVIAAISIAASLGLSANAQDAKSTTLNDLRGEWQEVGYRCEGTSNFNPRDNSSATKFFTIGSGVYFHRVAMTDWKNCSSVQSSGNLHTKANGDRLDVTAESLITLDCGNLVDDFALQPNPFSLRLDDIQGVSYMIISGDPTYVDESCSNPVVERVYAKLK